MEFGQGGRHGPFVTSRVAMEPRQELDHVPTHHLLSMAKTVLGFQLKTDPAQTCCAKVRL